MIAPHMLDNDNRLTIADEQASIPPSSSSNSDIDQEDPHNKSFLYRFFRFSECRDINNLILPACPSIGGSTGVLIWRSFVFLWSFSILIYTWSRNNDYPAKFLVYLTHWNQLSNFFYFSITFGVAVYYRLYPSRFSSIEVRRYSSLSILLHWWIQHAFTWCFVVVLIFWVLLYPKLDSSTNKNSEFYFNNICVHALVLLWSWTEMIIFNRVKFIIKQIIITIIVSLFYLIVNIVYVKVVDSVIYTALTWENASSLVTVVEAGLLELFAWGIIGVLCINRLKNKWITQTTSGDSLLSI